MTIFPDLAVFDDLPVSFWMSSGKEGGYKIAAWNRGATAIYGHSKEDVIGKSYLDIFVDKDTKVIEQSKKDADAVIAGSYKHPINCIAIDRNRQGQEVVLLTNVFLYEHKNVKYQAEIGVDLTPSEFLKFIDDEFKSKRTGPEHETERTLAALLKHSQNLFAMRRGRWIRTFTHESNSHIAIIKNALSELDEENPGILRHRFYADIAHSVRQLEMQSDNLLVSELGVRYGVGRGKPSQDSLLAGAVMQVVHEYEFAASSRRITIEFLPIDKNLSQVNLRGTRDAFVHTFRNIVSNAVQHFSDEVVDEEKVIKISAAKNESVLQIKVENAGHKDKSSDSPRLGIGIINAWTNELGGTFILDEAPQGHVIATLTWPVPRY